MTSRNTADADDGRQSSMKLQDARNGMLTTEHAGQSGGMDVGQPHVVENSGVLAETTPVNAAGGTSRPALDQADIGRSPGELSMDPRAVGDAPQRALSGVVEPRDTVLAGNDFDVCISGYDRNAQLASEPAAVGHQVAAMPVPRHDAASDSDSPKRPNTSAALEPAAAAVASVEIPAAMGEDIILWMYDDCCPTMQCISAADLPNELVFILMYIDVDDGSFFWAALLYDNMVRCCFVPATFN